MDTKAYAVILAGGKGERFWPLSTSKHPKQFLSLVGDKPLLAQAVDRLDGVIPPERVLVITNGDLVDVARRSAPRLPPENVIGEPMGRDTAAAIALGAALIESRQPDAAFVVLTADHIIGDLDIFAATLTDGLNYALQDPVLMTIGIEPATAGTGYGYIESGTPIKRAAGGTLLRKAVRFVEKPDRDTAQSYVESGNYYWNSGMFIWSVHTLKEAFSRYRPQLLDMMDAVRPAAGTEDFMNSVRTAYAQLEKISIDYAVMEKADNVVMAEGAFQWDDVGSWPALAHHFPRDDDGNVLLGTVEEMGSGNNIVLSGGRFTALIGVSDLIVVQADDVTLICPRDRAQDIKQFVHGLRDREKYAKWL
jgi:mannose-1-phosphate guanylyltransferase